MKYKLPRTYLFAATACAIGASTLTATSHARDGALQLAAADSIWCKVFGKGCEDQSTPGGTQNAPDVTGPAEVPAMSPSASPAAPSTDAAPPPPPPEPAAAPPPASPPPAAPSP